MASKITRLEPFKGTESPTQTDGPRVVEIARERTVLATVAPGSIEAELGASTEPTTVTETVQFTLAPRIPSMLLLEMGAIAAGGVNEDDPEAQGEYVGLIWSILTAALPGPEFRRFKKWANTAEPEVSIAELVHIIGQMVGVLTGRPTEGESSLPPGLPETPTGSTAHTEPAVETNGASTL